MTITVTAPRRPEYLAWFISGPLTVLTILLAVPAVAHHRPVFGSLPEAAAFLAVFVAADALSFTVEVRRHGLRIVPTEIPFIVALFYLPPLTLLLVRTLARLIVQARVGPPVKLAFNTSSILASTAVGALIVSYSDPLGTGPRSWLVLFAATVATVLFSVAAVLGVISLVQGGASLRRIVRTSTPGLAVGSINSAVGLLVLITIQRSPWALLLVAGLAAALFVVYRAYAQSLRQHRSLSEIYDLTRAVAETNNDVTLADVLLARVRGLLQAEWATLWLPAQGRFPETLLSARVDDGGLIDLSATPESQRHRAFDQGITVATGPKLDGDDQSRAALREAGTKDAIVVPLRSGGAVIGTLEVADRLGGPTVTFRAEDIRLLETVAVHASAAVENSRLVDRLRFDAHHDALTGLPNRRRMANALEQAVKVRAPGEAVAVLQFNLSGLRDVNESLGYAAGDELLSEVARRLREAAPAAALVARLGGDEFAVMLRTPGADAAIALAGELRQALQDPIEIGELKLDVDSAVGIAMHPDHGAEPGILLQRADVATHVAKLMSPAVQLFNIGLESRSSRRLALAGDLRRALDNDELEVYFQPKVSFRTRQLVGVECLARWERSAHGSVSPEDFVAVAEHTGQMGRLTEAVLREGLRRCREWSLAGKPLNVAVNLSPRTLTDPEFPAWVSGLLAEYDVSPDQLTLEMAENGMSGGSDRMLPILNQLSEMGVRLSVDDFGTGYSSLSYLRRLPVHEVKIDRTFIQGMATDPGDLAIVRAIVDLARHFGLSVVAEGVESELTLSLLEDIGCHTGQGFLFSRPLSYDRLEAWFSAQTEPEPTPAGEIRRLRAVP
ncbi:EAL domain-containing protein [Rugosimonospora acidiphila]|uniref:EAL domain-containing protein n=1 Tax=Rugosimonospora acidiphila TaxID=556531 RepID=A0ABP9RJG4_9ACTN